jgi:hypothetical protein
VPTTNPASWTNAVKTCEGTLVQGGCSAGQLCAPKPPAPFSNLCVYASGDLACPAGFPNKHVSFASYADTRSCTSCTCGTPTGITCNGSVDLHTFSDCTLGRGDMAAAIPQACTSTIANVSMNLASLTHTAGSCTRGGGAPSGACTPGTPTTICCQ